MTRFGIASAPAPASHYKVFWSLIMAGTKPHHGLRTAGGPGVMHAPPNQGPVMRVRAVRIEHAAHTERVEHAAHTEHATAASSTGVLATVRGWLKPLLPGAAAK